MARGGTGAPMRGPAPSEGVAGGASTFDALVGAIERTHAVLAARAGRAVNASLTLRNWLVGAYIVEYEQRGTDRAAYGARLLESVAERLQREGVAGTAARSLRLYRQFYLTYPEIRQTVTAESWDELALDLPAVVRSVTHGAGALRGTPVASDEAVPALPTDRLVAGLTFTHFAELLQVDDPLARRFYEAEALQGSWSVRELKRQIGTLYFERTGLSTDQAALAARVRGEAAARRQSGPGDFVRDPYVFEFLGLDPAHVMGESALEDALLDRLQAFLLELGYGFCFEARQKRLVIGGEHFFVDLVFYHRVLKCHVLVELKTEPFTHEHLGQLNTYVSYYRATQMTDGDQPPVGLLLCTAKNHALAEYALAGMNTALFVSRYLVGLPDREQISAFVRRSVEELRGDAPAGAGSESHTP